MNIIKATINEIPDIVRLNSFVQKIHHNKFPEIFKPIGNDAEVQRFFESVIRKEDNYIFIAYIEDAPVGYSWVALETKPDSVLKYGREQVYVHQIAVHDNFRRQHIGKALFDQIIKLAKHQRIDLIEVDTWAFNTNAYKFFEKLGFETYNIKMWQKPKQNT